MNCEPNGPTLAAIRGENVATEASMTEPVTPLAILLHAARAARAAKDEAWAEFDAVDIASAEMAPPYPEELCYTVRFHPGGGLPPKEAPLRLTRHSHHVDVEWCARRLAAREGLTLDWAQERLWALLDAYKIAIQAQHDALQYDALREKAEALTDAWQQALSALRSYSPRTLRELKLWVTEYEASEPIPVEDGADKICEFNMSRFARELAEIPDAPPATVCGSGDFTAAYEAWIKAHAAVIECKTEGDEFDRLADAEAHAFDAMRDVDAPSFPAMHAKIAAFFKMQGETTFNGEGALLHAIRQDMEVLMPELAGAADDRQRA